MKEQIIDPTDCNWFMKKLSKKKKISGSVTLPIVTGIKDQIV